MRSRSTSLTVLVTLAVVVPALAVGIAHAQTPNLDAERAARTRDALESDDAMVALAGLSRALVLVEHLADPAAEAKLLDDVAARSKDPITRSHAAFEAARRRARAGDVDGALKGYAALGFVPQVRAIGPFPNTGGSSFGQPLDALDGVGAQARAAGLEREVGWQTVPVDAQGELDLVPRIAPTHDTRALVAFVVEVRAAAPAALRIGSSGQVRALVNGVEVVRADVDRPLTLDQTSAGIQLVKGPNLVVIEAGFVGDDASLRLRLTRPDGGPLSGLAFLVDDKAFARAAKTKPSASAAPVVVDPLARLREQPADAARTSWLRSAVALEERLKAGDARRRPPELETWLLEFARALDADKSPAARAESATVLARAADVIRRRDLTAARALLDDALARDPNSVEALLVLASLREDQDDARRARDAYARAREVAPGSDVVVRRALAFERRDGRGGIDNDLAILARAKEAPTEDNLGLAADVLEERGDVAGALALAEKAGDAARANRLKNTMADARLADDATAQAALEERVGLARALVRMRPGNHTAAQALALALVAAGRKSEAAAFAASRVREFPERAEPLALQARLALLDGNRDAAQQALVAALALTPQDAELQRTLRSLGKNEEELVVRYGLDPDAYKNDPAPDGADKLGAWVAATTTAIRFFDNGLGRVITDRVIKVVDAQKAAGLQSFGFPYTQGRERLDILVAERITKDGRHEPAMRVVDNGPGGKEGGVYTDVASKTVVLGKLADGDLVHVRTRKELVGQQNLFGDFFGTLEPIQGVVPVKRFRLVVEAPPGRALAWGGRNAPRPVVREEGGRRVYDFVVKDTPALEVEQGMPPWLEQASFVSVSTYASWDALGAWYEKLVAPQLALNDELKTIARDIKASSKNEEEIVRRVYEYVVTATRYVGIELGIHGWKPYPVTEIHRRKYGDCKDKASLLVALLREAGVPANIALVRTANIGVIEPDPPSMWTFNHAIAYVPSLDLFLDGTAERSGWREIPAMDQGALTLVVGKHGDKPTSELRTIPVSRPDDNLNVSDYVLRLGLDGTLSVHGTEKFRGTHNADQRRDFADPATRRERLEAHLAQIMPGTRVTKVDVSDLALSVAETSYTFDATLPERAVRDASGGLTMALSLYPHDLVGNYAEQSTRKTDIFLDRPWRTRNVMRYVVPADVAVADLPTGGTVKSKYLSFTQTITKTDDGFIVDEDTSILVRRIPVADYAAFREAALKADALMKRKVRFVRKSS